MAGESSVPKPELSIFRTAEIRSEKFSTDRRRKLFRVVAKHAYPRDTVRKVRKLTRGKYGERTVYDWLRGTTDAPLAVFIHLVADILQE